MQSGLDESVPLEYILGHGHIGYFFDQQYLDDAGKCKPGEHALLASLSRRRRQEAAKEVLQLPARHTQLALERIIRSEAHGAELPTDLKTKKATSDPDERFKKLPNMVLALACSADYRVSSHGVAYVEARGQQAHLPRDQSCSQPVVEEPGRPPSSASVAPTRGAWGGHNKGDQTGGRGLRQPSASVISFDSTTAISPDGGNLMARPGRKKPRKAARKV